MNSGRIMIFNDNLKLIRCLISGLQKATQYTQERSATISAIKEKCKEMVVMVNFEYVISYKQKVNEFKQDLLVYLIQ